MSAIYRFGFEFERVPEGVTINSGNYLYIGRDRSACSLYGNWPNVSCSIDSTTGIRGSLYAATYNHNLTNVTHNDGQSFVEFGDVKLRCNASGTFAINVAGSDIATITGIQMFRGEWIPIRYNINLGIQSLVEFEIKNQVITGRNQTTTTPQTTIKIGGFGGTGNLEDIAINLIGNGLDTGIPSSVSCVPAFYTGYGNSNQWEAFGSVAGNSISASAYFASNAIPPETVYIPNTNNIILQCGRYNSGVYPLKLNLKTNTLETWFSNFTFAGATQGLVLTRVCYCPSRNSTFCLTGAHPSFNRRMVEIDINNNIINTGAIIFSDTSNLTAYAAYYNAKSNKIYFAQEASNSRAIYYIDCETLQTSSINLSYSIADATTFAGHPLVDYIYYRTADIAGSAMAKLNLINTGINTIVGGGVGANSFFSPVIMPNIGSGFNGNANTTFTLFNLYDSSSITGTIAGADFSFIVGYSPISNNIFASRTTLRYISMDQTGDNTTIQTFNEESVFNTYGNFCPYNNCSYLVTDNLPTIWPFSHSERKLYSNSRFNFPQFIDNGYLRSANAGTASNFKTIPFSGNYSGYEGTNVFLNSRKSSRLNPVIDIGIVESGATNRTLRSVVPGVGFANNSVSSFYDEFGNKISVTSGHNIQSYMKYSGIS